MTETIVKVNIQLLLDRKIVIRFSHDDSEDERAELYGLLMKMNGKLCRVYEINEYDEVSFFKHNFPHWEYLVAVNDEYEKNGKGIDWCKEEYFDDYEDMKYVIKYSVHEFLGNQFVDNDETLQMFNAVFD